MRTLYVSARAAPLIEQARTHELANDSTVVPVFVIGMRFSDTPNSKGGSSTDYRVDFACEGHPTKTFRFRRFF